MEVKQINNFISSIENSLYNKIRQSKSDAECRRYLKEHLQNISSATWTEDSKPENYA